MSKDDYVKFKCTKCFENYTLFFDKNANDGDIYVNNEYLLTPKPEALKYCKKGINMRNTNNPKYSYEKCIKIDILTQ